MDLSSDKELTSSPLWKMRVIEIIAFLAVAIPSASYSESSLDHTSSGAGASFAFDGVIVCSASEIAPYDVFPPFLRSLGFDSPVLNKAVNSKDALELIRPLFVEVRDGVNGTKPDCGIEWPEGPGSAEIALEIDRVRGYFRRLTGRDPEPGVLVLTGKYTKNLNTLIIEDGFLGPRSTVLEKALNLSSGSCEANRECKKLEDE